MPATPWSEAQIRHLSAALEACSTGVSEGGGPSAKSGLDELADPIAQATQNKDSEIVIKPEHTQRLSDLNTELSKSLAAFEQQQLLLDAITKETASIPPHASKLKQLYSDRRSAATKASQQRIVAALEAARKEAEQAQVDHLKKLQQEVIDTETKHHEKKLAAEKDQKDRLGQLDTQQTVEETGLEERSDEQRSPD